MSFTPLAERIRPIKIADYIGQKHILGVDKPLRKSLENGMIPSMIFWGPPGVGKTSLANLIAKELDVKIHILSAISSGVKDVRDVIHLAENQGIFNTKRNILFIDEIHRFSKAQQDSLLGAVEKGTITLIGATTENPSFEVISALLSRCQVFTLESHNKEDLEKLLQRATSEDCELKKKKINLLETNQLIALSGGDARKLLNLFEIIISIHGDLDEIYITDELVKNSAQKSVAIYDKNGEMHYDIISAFIKSIRGSDPNAAIYYLARLIDGGEDPKFIARRMLISASEDIGMANPTALILANTTFQAVEKIGWPESRIILSQCAIYLATSSKGNASYLAIDEAIELVKKTGDLPIPLHLRNAPTKLMKDLSYGKNYEYAHNYEGNFVELEFLPEKIKGHNFIHSGSNKREQEITELIEKIWKGKYKDKDQNNYL
jgi:putative ATPase